MTENKDSTDIKEFDKGYVLFFSTVAGSVLVEKNTERVKFLLSAQKIKYTAVDIAANAAGKEFMQKHSTNAKKNSIPQVFKDGSYIGTCEEMDEANEDGNLKTLLKA